MTRFVARSWMALVLVMLVADAAAEPSPSPSYTLAGSSWQLVLFHGSDGIDIMPESSKYTIDFGTDGRLSARIDCNRGRGTWKTSVTSGLELGPLALTRVKCPPGSLHDQVVRHWELVRSFAIRGGHLFLSLDANGRTYEFEPMTASVASPRPRT
jgi:para-nitrobenzyl esterase